jgi:hypothetical protein
MGLDVARLESCPEQRFLVLLENDEGNSAHNKSQTRAKVRRKTWKGPDGPLVDSPCPRSY